MLQAELKKVLGPGLSTIDQSDLKHQNDFNEKLRMKWFITHRERITDLAEGPSKIDKKKIKEELCRIIKERQKTSLRYPQCIVPEPEPPKIEIDPYALTDTMRPVAKEHLDILYGTDTVDNRKTYLKLRANIQPENKYYFPETMSFKYGWKVLNYTRKAKTRSFGKSRILKETFYRKNGSKTQDPEWYTECMKFSPTVCDCLG